MKRSELNVGDVLYFDSAPDWEYEGPSYKARQAIVLDAEAAWTKPHHRGWKRDTSFWPEVNGYGCGKNGILVELIDRRYTPADGKEPDGQLAVVQAQHLRGEFVATKATVDANRQARLDREQMWADERGVAEQAQANLVAQLLALGIKASADHRNRNNIEISVTTAAELIDRLSRIES